MYYNNNSIYEDFFNEINTDLSVYIVHAPERDAAANGHTRREPACRVFGRGIAT